jgi:hypothetical protein
MHSNIAPNSTSTCKLALSQRLLRLSLATADCASFRRDRECYCNGVRQPLLYAARALQCNQIFEVHCTAVVLILKTARGAACMPTLQCLEKRLKIYPHFKL